MRSVLVRSRSRSSGPTAFASHKHRLRSCRTVPLWQIQQLLDMSERCRDFEVQQTASQDNRRRFSAVCISGRRSSESAVPAPARTQLLISDAGGMSLSRALHIVMRSSDVSSQNSLSCNSFLQLNPRPPSACALKSRTVNLHDTSAVRRLSSRIS